MNRPYAESCEQNKDVIHEVIQSYLTPGIDLLEIGSGTAQHAVYFAGLHPDIHWQTSDRTDYLAGIESWVSFVSLPNLNKPILLDVSAEWPTKLYDRIFTANSLHIMSESEAEQCIRGAAARLKRHGYLMVYGPFNYNGEFTSESNRQFERWLKSNNPASCIKHFEAINEIAEQSGLKLVDDIAMPANNRTLIWQLETLSEK